ncbi:unnamed protein product [Closterium sp. NIES-65]|nr:unnamed protein product [Closterium sp. NIES-65]
MPPSGNASLSFPPPHTPFHAIANSPLHPSHPLPSLPLPSPSLSAPPHPLPSLPLPSPSLSAPPIPLPPTPPILLPLCFCVTTLFPFACSPLPSAPSPTSLPHPPTCVPLTSRAHASQRLVDALDSVPGGKALVLDASISGPLAFIAPISLLKEHGVENLFHISADPIQSQCSTVLYLLRPNPLLIRWITRQVRADEDEGVTRSYSLHFIPRCDAICTRVLEQEGLVGDPRVAVGEYPLEMIPVDHDLLALDLHTLYKDVHVDSDPTSTLQVARVLANFQSVFGVPPVLKGKGVAAQRVAQAMSQLMKEQKSHVAPVEHPSVDMMVLIDRQVDMVTPACTQLTYEGLLDELLHVANGAVEVDPAVMGVTSNARKIKVPLNSNPSCAALPSSPSSPSSPCSPSSTHLYLCIEKLFQKLRAFETSHASSCRPSPPSSPYLYLCSDKLFQDLRGRNFGSAAESFTCLCPLFSLCSIAVSALFDPLSPLSPLLSLLPSSAAARQGSGDEVRLLRAKAVEMKSEYANLRQRPQRDASPLRSAAPGGQGAASAAAAAAGGGEQTVSELKDFVKKLNVLPELTRHTNLAGHISQVTNRPAFGALISTEQAILEARSIDSACEYIEDAMAQGHPMSTVLRLLSLVSLTNGGIPKARFDHLRREFLQAYGFLHVFSLDNFERAGLIKRQEGRSTWVAVKRSLRLIVDDDDDANPRDIAFTFSGYAPLSVRLLQQAIQPGGWRAMDEVTKTATGPTFEWEQSPDGTTHRDVTNRTPSAMRRGPSESVPRLVAAVFLGGVTFAEVAALRFLSMQDSAITSFLIITTNIVSGNSLLQPLIETV